MTAQILAYLCIGWPILSTLWKLADDVSSTVYYSQFFKWVFLPITLALQIGLAAGVLAGTVSGGALAAGLLIPAGIAFVWEIADSPYKITFHDKFYQVVATLTSFAVLVLAIITALV